MLVTREALRMLPADYNRRVSHSSNHVDIRRDGVWVALMILHPEEV